MATIARRSAEGLKERGWTAAHLLRERKGDGFKVALAAKLRAETTVTLAWIAAHLQMGARGHLAQLLYLHARPAAASPNQCQLWK